MASLGSGRWNTVHCSFITVLLISACLVSEKCCESPSSQLIAGLNDGTIPDLETSETGVIDTNLVDVNNVGERGYFPCKDLGKLLYFPLSLSSCIFQSFQRFTCLEHESLLFLQSWSP